MNNLKTVILSAAVMAAFSSAQAEEIPVYPGYELTWHDEFDVDGTPASHWNYEHGFCRNNEDQWYQPQNAKVEDGCLVITARLDSIPNDRFDPASRRYPTNRPYARYSSSCLTTSDSFTWKYGRMEVRARIPVNSGAWPAIWTLGNKYRWPANGEVDIMEFYRRSEPIILANACWKGPGHEVTWDGASVPFTHFTEKDPMWASKFHVWRMDWDKDFIRIYLDDELINEIVLAEAANGGGNNRDVNPFSNDDPDFGAYILLNMAIGGDNGGVPDDANFPLRYEVDYVRVYSPVKD